MFSLQLSLVSVADNSHFCLFHINPYAKHKILVGVKLGVTTTATIHKA